MQASICTLCGTQYAPSKEPPKRCAICEDERQWVNPNGQQWTLLDNLVKGHSNQIKALEPNLLEIRTAPIFAIGQRALLVQTQEGNILWDCVSLIDQETIDRIKGMGGVKAIAISHPHFYSAMVEWSRAFGQVPIYLHEADRSHVMRPDPNIIFWKGASRALWEGCTLIHCGGHFAGSAVLHWAQGAERRGVLLSGDTIYVTPDTRHMSFMYSYPNLIPLGKEAIVAILQAIQPFKYDRIYSGWFCCQKNASYAMAASARRYLHQIGAVESR